MTKFYQFDDGESVETSAQSDRPVGSAKNIRTGKSEPTYPTAFVTFTKGKISPNFDFTKTKKSDQNLSDEYIVSQEEAAVTSNQVGMPKPKDMEVPSTLFTTTPTTIDTMFVDRRMVHHIPTLLGPAFKNAQSVGMPPQASYDLSADSAPLVKKYVERGVISPHQWNANAEVLNSLGHGRPNVHEDLQTDLSNLSSLTRMPQETVNEMRQLGRESIRPSRPAAPVQHVVKDSPQFEQLRLDL